MLRGNLSTRPFYNDRVVTLGVALLGVLVLVLTAFNVVRLVGLFSAQGATESRLASTRGETAQVRAETARQGQGVEPGSLSRLALSSTEANDLIDQRMFSWTALFGILEAAMPPDVRLVSVSPSVDKTDLKVSMTILARDLIDVDSFTDALLDTGAFYDVSPVQTLEREDGYAAEVEASYLPPGAVSVGEGRQP